MGELLRGLASVGRADCSLTRTRAGALDNNILKASGSVSGARRLLFEVVKDMIEAILQMAGINLISDSA
jgi:hypothetical protein